MLHRMTNNDYHIFIRKIKIKNVKYYEWGHLKTIAKNMAFTRSNARIVDGFICVIQTLAILIGLVTNQLKILLIDRNLVKLYNKP